MTTLGSKFPAGCYAAPRRPKRRLDNSLGLVVDVRLDVEHLHQRHVEEAVLVQNVADHPQSSTAQVSLLHQVLLSDTNSAVHNEAACGASANASKPELYLHRVRVVFIHHGAAAHDLQVTSHLHSGTRTVNKYPPPPKKNKKKVRMTFEFLRGKNNL